MLPINIINDWLEQEIALGSAHPNRIVLATAANDSIPHARVVAIREINESGLLFFTQRDTRKVFEMTQNNHVSGVIWLPLQQRQVTIEGVSVALTYDENLQYWLTMPRDRQLRFCAYAPTSGQAIKSTSLLDDKLAALDQRYRDLPIPMSEYYCGYRLEPDVISFYTLGGDKFSDVVCYRKVGSAWQDSVISP